MAPWCWVDVRLQTGLVLRIADGREVTPKLLTPSSGFRLGHARGSIFMQERAFNVETVIGAFGGEIGRALAAGNVGYLGTRGWKNKYYS